MLLAPWYVYRPSQIFRRLRANPAPGYHPLRTAWGGSVIADPTKTIGRSILTTGVYDLAVTEAIVRLVEPGSICIDAGANVGYMSALMLAAGARVTAYEPHPELFAVLQQNAPGADCRNVALGSSPGRATLTFPSDFSGNDGTARIGNGAGIEVELAMLGDACADVLKIDVEGYELEVLKGSSLNFRHIIFEEHDLNRSTVIPYLLARGFSIYSLGWSLRGPKIAPGIAQLVTPYEATSFIATKDAAQLVAKLSPHGWRSLTSQQSKSRS